MPHINSPGAANGHVRTVLRLEGLAMLAVATVSYFSLGGELWPFLLLFFVADLSFLAYMAGARIGALAYNTVHSTLLPAAMGLIGWFTGTEPLWQVSLILAAHIGFDRLLGYGLKYASAFNMTHLGRVGRKA